MMARTLDRLLEEGDRQVDMDARPVAGLAVRIHRAPVPHGLQRIVRGRHDTAGRLAVDSRDHADAAGNGLHVRPAHALAPEPPAPGNGCRETSLLVSLPWLISRVTGSASWRAKGV